MQKKKISCLYILIIAMGVIVMGTSCGQKRTELDQILDRVRNHNFEKGEDDQYDPGVTGIEKKFIIEIGFNGPNWLEEEKEEKYPQCDTGYYLQVITEVIMIGIWPIQKLQHKLRVLIHNWTSTRKGRLLLNSFSKM